METKYKYRYTIDPAGSTIEREPSGIIESYEKVMKIFHELGHSIYGDRR